MNILVLIDFNKEQEKRIREIVPQATWVYSDPKSATKEQIQEADIILGNPRARDLVRF